MELKWEKLLSEKTLKERTYIDKDTDARSPYESDYDRIVFSTPFRRLQDKAQLFPLEKYDFVRTRLTHSIEVAAIARSLGITVCKRINQDEKLKNKYGWKEEFCSYIPVVLESAGLIHDLGNPPFGHKSERVIQDYFKSFFKEHNILNDNLKKDFENFDGNVQTFRIITHLQCIHDLYGYHLTSALLSTVMKYPVSSSEIKTTNDIRSKKFGYFNAEKSEAKEIFDNTGLIDNDYWNRHPLTYLLEAADDIAYSAGDIEDGFKKGLVSLNTLRDFFLKYISDIKKSDNVDKADVGIGNIYKVIRVINAIDENYKTEDDKNTNPNYDDELKNIKADSFITNEKRIQWVRITIQGILTKCSAQCFIENYDLIMNGKYNKDLIENSEAGYLRKALKKFSIKYLISNIDVVKTESEGETVMKNLLNLFLQKIPEINDIVEIADNNRIVLSEKFNMQKSALISKDFSSIFVRTLNELIADKKSLDSNDNKSIIYYHYFLLITDFISGMTDSYCVSLYRKLNGIDIY